MISATSVFRQRPFLWFTAGQTISFFGDKLHAMALIGLVGTRAPKESPLVLAGLALLYCVPFLVVAPIAGVCVDRWNRRRTLILCDLIRAGVVVAMPLTYAHLGLGALLAMVLAIVVLTLLFNAAKMAIIPDLVPHDALLEANAVSSVLSRVATLAGVVLGGAIVGASVWEHFAWPGFAVGFYLDAFTFMISVSTLVMMPAGPRASGRGPRHSGQYATTPGLPQRFGTWREDVREVFEVVRRQPMVRFVLAASSLLGAIAGAMYVLLVVLIQTRTPWGTTGVGILLGVVAGGIVAGSAIVARVGRAWPRPHIVIGAFAALSVVILSFAAPFSFASHGPAAFGGGLALGPLMVALDTMLHERVADRLRGRVFSARDIVLNVAFGLSAATIGVTVAYFDRQALDALGLVIPVVAALVVSAAGAGHRWLARAPCT